jgi:FtsP/CotA-like multicopper oxidase with cupredoxin domain
VRETGLSHRGFLLTGAAGLAAASGVLGVRAAPAAPAAGGEGPGRELVLVAREVRWELTPGKVVAAMAYNGQVPGPAVRVREGERVRVRLGNMSMEAHPIHLYGQSFRLLGVNGDRLDRSLIKDSLDVEAHMGSVVVEFTAHIPGDWFFHCHKPMHMEGDMIEGDMIVRPRA